MQATSAAWNGGLFLPRSPEILQSYAQALKLEESDDWQIFEALAVQESLPKGFRTVQRDTRRIQPLVTAADIEAWADLISAAAISLA